MATRSIKNGREYARMRHTKEMKYCTSVYVSRVHAMMGQTKEWTIEE